VLILDTFEVGRGNIRFILDLIQFELSRWSNSELLIDCFNTIKKTPHIVTLTRHSDLNQNN